MKRCLLLFLVFVFLGNTILCGEQPPDLDKIIVALEQTKKSIFDNESLFLRYDRLGCEDLLRSQFSGGDIPVKWELAWKKDKFYAKRTYCPTDAQKKDNSVIITEEPSVLILKNRKLLNWSKGFSKCDIEIFSGFVTLNLIKEWTIFEFLGYNVAEKILTTSGNDYQKTCEQTKDEPAFYFLSLPYLPETLREHQTDYHIKPTRDNIDNHLCWVIGRTSSDTIWIDDNFRIRKRLLYDQLYKNSIKYVINYRDHREIKPNIWIPLTLSIDIYANPFVEPEVNWGKVAKRWTIKISEFEINQVPDNLFDVTPDVGTLVQDFDKNERYRIVKKGSDPFAGPIAQGITANRYVVYRAIFITLGSFLILLYFWLKFRERRE